MKARKDGSLRAYERASLTLRACGLLRARCPRLIETTLKIALLNALSPFAAIWFSARIVSELSGEPREERLILLTSLLALSRFLITAAGGYLEKIKAEREGQMWLQFGWIFAEKQLRMDYQQVEDAGVQKTRVREKENLFTYGNGLGQFVWTFCGLLEGGISVVASLALVVSLFTSGSGGAWDGALWCVPVLGIMLAGAFAGSEAFKRQNRAFIKWCDASARFSRAFEFFANLLPASGERAPDARIYRQHIAADDALGRINARERADRKHDREMALPEALAAATTRLCHGLCYGFAALKAYGGAFGAGMLVQYAGALFELGKGLEKCIFCFADNDVYTRHLKRLFAYLDLPGANAPGTNVRDPGNALAIEFKDVSFRYPGREDWALRHVSFALRTGERLGLVGQNGSGKTTLVKLLCRLYVPEEGEILLDGVNIQAYSPASYEAALAVVFQDFSLFAFPLFENVAAGANPEAARAEACLREAGFGARLSEMPEGGNTFLYRDYDGRGVEISGGEAQKLALARALYKDAPLMILDEPTSALDPIAEAEIYERFGEILRGRTAIFISHRLSSCRFLNRILVLDQGKIVQAGDHEALLCDKSGLYARLWHAQAQYYGNNA